MAGVLYRCIFCDVSHEGARRADGPIYLRCPTTYRWAWYDERAFEQARPARGAIRASGGAAGARRRTRAKPAARRAGSSSRAKAATSRRAGRRASARPSARKRSRKGGRR